MFGNEDLGGFGFSRGCRVWGAWGLGFRGLSRFRVGALRGFRV